MTCKCGGWGVQCPYTYQVSPCPKCMTLSAEDSAALQEALDSPPAPNERLIALFEEHSASMEYLRQSERRDYASQRLHEVFDSVLVERIPDDMQSLIERLGDAPPSERGDGTTG